MYVITTRGAMQMKTTTRAWKYLAKWRYSSKIWILLKDLKKSYPIEVVEYVMARGIHDEPAYAWWVPYALKNRDILIFAVHYMIRKINYKYGIEIPTNIEHAYSLDAINGNSFWHDAIRKEMKDVGIAFEILSNGQ